MTTEAGAWVAGTEAEEGSVRRDPWWVVWGRRSLTIPLFTILLVLAVALAPLLAGLAAGVDLIRGGNWVVLRCLAFFTWYLACEIIGIVSSLVLWVASLVDSRHDRRQERERTFGLQCWWARALLSGATRIFGLRFEADVPEDIGRGPLLLFVRHTSVGDTLLPSVYLSERFRLMLRYVLKRELLWDPCLDIVGNRLPNYFARRGSGDSRREVRAVQALLDDLGPRDGVLIYPEGTRFTPAKRARTLARIAATERSDVLALAQTLQHVLPPRLGGPLGLLERNPGADVVFGAHTGFEGAGTFTDLLRGHLVHATVRVCFWRIPYADIPTERSAQIAWLYVQWQRVDEWVGKNKAPRDMSAA